MMHRVIIVFMTTCTLWAQADDANEVTRLPLIQFNSSSSGWKANPWGGGTITVAPGEAASSSMRIRFTKATGTVVNTVLYSQLQNIWKSSPCSGFYIICRGEIDSGGDIFLHYVANDRYVTKLGLKRDNSWQTIRVGFGGWSKGGKPFVKADLRELQIEVHGSGSLEISEIGLYADCRAMTDTLKTAAKEKSVMLSDKEPRVDGTIQDSEWNSPIALLLPSSADSRVIGKMPPVEKTDIFIQANDKGLFIAARCFKKDMKKLKSNYTQDSKTIHEDECIELYFDPGRKMSGAFKKFALNANGFTGRENPADRKSFLKTVAKKYADRWELEVYLPWETLGVTNLELPTALGFNVTRTTWEGSATIERSGWTTTVWNAVQKFGVLFIEKENAAKEIQALELESFGKVGGGAYLVTGNCTNHVLDYKVTVHSPNAGETALESNGKISNHFWIPIVFQPKKTGDYPVQLMIYDTDGHVRQYREAILSENTEADTEPLAVDDVSLFPEPKIFLKSDKTKVLPSQLKYFVADASLVFCGERIRSEMQEFYQLPVSRSDSAAEADIVIALDPNGADPSKMLDAKYWKKIKDDGFALIITEGKILICALEKRGARYGVDALLDLIKMYTVLN